MSRRLAQTLITNGTATQAEVEEAFQRQVLYGGSLGTNLLESDTVTEEQLEEALAATYSLPRAGKADIDGIGAHIPRLFPQVFAESYHLVPYKLEGSELGVLVNGEPDEQLLARIKERLALEAAPAVTSEIRLHYAMNQLYGSELLPRVKTLLSRLDGTMVVSEPSDTRPSGQVLSWGMSAGSSASPATKRGKLNLREVLAQLEFATDRDTIVNLLLNAVAAIFDFSALFLVQGQLVNGWRASTPEGTQRVARISMPVELPSVFQTIYATQGHYLGPLPQNSINTKLLEDLGRAAPRAAFVAPLIIGGKLAMIAYADNGPRAISPRRVAAVLLLAQRCTIAFERLIRKRKAAAHQAPDEAPKQDWDESTPIEFDLADKGSLVPPPEEPAEYQAVADAQITKPLQITVSPDDPEGGWSASDTSFHGVDQSPGASRQAFEKSIEEAAGSEVDLDEDYVAFADIEDDAEENLDGWGDVLVETQELFDSQPELATPAPAAAAPPSVTWNDVIAETKIAASILPRPRSGPIEVAGTTLDETELLFDGLLAQDPRTRRDTIQKLLAKGSRIDEGLAQRFPGEVGFDPMDPQTRVPPFVKCSGICELLLARGTEAAGVVLPFLEHEDPTKRFFAIYFLLAVHYPTALEALARRLYDTEPRNRHLAADALRNYANEGGFKRIVEALRSQLKMPVVEQRISTVQLLGQLRDPSCVPELIPMVVAPEPDLARAATSALSVICAQDFGTDVPGWSEWWRQNYNRPRPVWLIQGLRHPAPGVRRMANYELQLLTGMTTHFDAEAPEAQREESVAMWENWWMHVSRGTSTKTAAQTG